MKVKLCLFLACVLGLLCLCSCHWEAILPKITTDTTADRPEETMDTDASVSIEEPSPPRFTVDFDENEIFSTEAEEKAAKRIDPAIRKAVEVLNTAEIDLPPVLDCDYSARPTERDRIKDPLTAEVYDIILQKTSAFEPYHFSEKDYPGVDFFCVFVTAVDALRIDRTDLFLYCDGIISGTEYYSGYYMPGDERPNLCDDIEAVRSEVAVCDAVAKRILDKMPRGMSNAEKCVYFAMVLSSGVEYNYEENYPRYDYQAYSALVTGSAVCSGYAQAFYRLCRDAGISCWYCRGTTPEGRHAWNRLDTDEGPVYMDVTWYDPGADFSDYRDGKEQYLFMTQEDFDYFGYVQETCQ